MTTTGSTATGPLVISGVGGLRALVGKSLGVSAWHTVTQQQVTAFADVTDDYNWIHLDDERAKRSGFPGAIAHGLLTLSLEPKFTYEIYDIQDIDHSLDYGYAKVRFPAPVPVGARLRMTSFLRDLEDVDGGVQCTVVNVIELDGSDRPACVAELMLRVIGDE